MISLGMVHGRFQPFHLGHLEYVLEAAARCATLIVGVTNPDPLRIRHEAANPARSAPEANPFSYFTRYCMVQRSLVGAGLSADRIVIVPFPIHEPELWIHYVPGEATHLLRVFSAWERTKIERLRVAGFSVVDLAYGRAKTFSGTEVRRRWREGGDWRSLVPRPVAEIMELAATGRIGICAP